MKIKAIIKTPKGQATKAQATLQNVIFGKLWRRYDKFESFVNEDDSECAWEIETKNVSDYVRITRNLASYEVIVRKILESKRVKKEAAKNFSAEDMARLKEMLQSQTSIEVIKEATAAELDEYNKSWWQRTKEKMKKIF
jgi:hypothetical protein